MAGRIPRIIKTFLMCLMDCLFQCASYAGAILLFTYLRKIPGGFMIPYINSIPLMALSCTVIFLAFGIYRDLWGYISLIDLIRLTVGTGVASFLGYLSMRFVWGVWPSPIIGVTAFYFFLTATVGVRMIPSFLSAARNHITFKTIGNDDRIPTLIVGAGEAGAALVKDFENQGSHTRYRVVGFADDSDHKQKHVLRGLPILGRTEEIPAIAKRHNVQEIIIAIPSASTEQRRRIVAACAPTGCKVRMMTGVSQVGDAQVTSLHNMDVNDLLGRREIALDPKDMATYITGNVILITGGGGSIGSELCRQIMRFDPARLVIYDFYENNAYDVQQQLRVQFPEKSKNVVLRIGSVQDRVRLGEVFEEFSPAVVFHAAAYKHVPLMEECPELAIQNNVFGTYNVATACVQNGVRRFVMISTDKAVNPTNVMGASKRIAELTIQSMNGQGTEFVAVRFGNVLGSNGSVVPLFKRQIEAGGPVTVMDPEIIRYFMTIPEAARLVLQAGAMANGGETFILDMGEPVKILDLAVSMIEMAGLEPYTDIPIQFVGLRPGEKLYEELLLNAEGAQKTKDDKIYVAHSTVLTNAERRDMLDKLHRVIAEKGNVKAIMQEIVPDYRAETVSEHTPKGSTIPSSSTANPIP